MKKLILILFLFVSAVTFAQVPVKVKARLYKPTQKSTISIQLNNEPIVQMGENVYQTFQLKQSDRLTFYINKNLVETIEISQKIIDRQSLNILLTETTVLDEVEIEYTNMNNKLGLGTSKQLTKAERNVKIDRQITYNDKSSATGNIKMDGFVNKLTGRAKTNKKALSVEREIQSMERFLKVYSPDFLYENYSLPKNKAPYFALHMMDFMNESTRLDSDGFRMLVEEQLLNFKYD
ncbi:hypothetical protein [Paenimyroides aestuarii]|uniref:DUF4369 domain-containing protein n=1 Tax=Paenimyroides aestuarii TaxID=2968490 RepID=A0ABY5NSC4_9FLAO|nr:hypothetical protein [Paenimyroides aestuarii]UUV21474.1 hypothetical protein NPX36_14320 [Paenimyroides aestuarii]